MPKKENELEKVLKTLLNINYSIVFFIPGSKINFYIPQFKKYFFGRKIVIAKEMTKIHEEFIREQVATIKSPPESLKGELTVILSKKIKRQNIKKDRMEKSGDIFFSKVRNGYINMSNKFYFCETARP